MGTSKQHGFTIIETVLFLGVSGLLLVLLVIGAGSSLNTQRYKDAVQSFRSTLQAQYTELSTIKNIRNNNWSCGPNAVASEGGANTAYRGQGDCLLVGKYVRIDNNDMRIYSVLARPTAVHTAGLNDVNSLRTNYALAASTTVIEQRTLDWGTAIAWPKSGSGARPVGTSRQMSLFFVRSPDSGTVYTFTGDTIPVDPEDIGQNTFNDILIAGDAIPGQGSRTICIISNGLVKSGDTAIYLKSYASSASAVETRSNEFMLSQSAGASQC